MQISVTFRNMEPSEALKSYAQEKAQRLLKYVSLPVDVQFVLGKHKYLSIVEIKVAARGVVLKSVEENEDMYGSIDLAMDKIERQARRYKDKLVHRRPTGDSAVKIRQGIITEEIEDTKEDEKLVDVEEFHATPMTLDEAVKTMNAKNKDSLVFIHAQTQDVNVIYKRADGKIGIIQTNQQEENLS